MSLKDVQVTHLVASWEMQRSEKIRENHDREWGKQDVIGYYFDFWRVVAKDRSLCWKAVTRSAATFEALISYAPDFLLGHLAMMGVPVDQQTGELIMSVIVHEFERTDYLLQLPKWGEERRAEYEQDLLRRMSTIKEALLVKARLKVQAAQLQTETADRLRNEGKAMRVTNNNVAISGNGRWNQDSIDVSTNDFQSNEITSALDQLVRISDVNPTAVTEAEAVRTAYPNKEGVVARLTNLSGWLWPIRPKG